MTSMKISEGREMGADTVPGNDEEVERVVADTGNSKGGPIGEIIMAYQDQCQASCKLTIMIKVPCKNT